MPNSGDSPAPEEILTRVATMAAKLSERSRESQELRQLPEQTIAAYIDTGLNKALQPRRYGGWSVDWETHVAIAFELAKGDGSQSWALTSYADFAQQLGTFDPQAQDDVWGKEPLALVTGSRVPGGALLARDGGYVVSGAWTACAGIEHASWLIASGFTEAGNSASRVHFLIPKSSATVSDDWYSSGLVGSGAKSFVLKDVVVPRHRVLEEKDYQAGTGPGLRVNPEVGYRFPRDGAILALAAVPVGVAAAMLESFIALACDTVKRGRRVENNFSTSLRIGESIAEIDAARLALLDAARVTTAMLVRGEIPSAEQRSLNGVKSVHGVALAMRAADRLFAAGGAKVNMLSNPLQRYLLDIHALAAQDVFNWDKRCSRYGRLRLGESI